MLAIHPQITSPTQTVVPGIFIPNIKRLQRIDIAGAVEALAADPTLWTDNTYRQDAERTAHRDTETVYLVAPKRIEFNALVDVVPTVDHRGMAVPALRALVDRVRAVHPWPLARAMIIKLKPGGVIKAHTDAGPFAAATERFHLPLTTNPWAWLCAGSHTVCLRAGVLYWFNKHVEHDGANDGATDRVHLVIDRYRP